MGSKQVLDRMEFVLWGESIRRVNVEQGANGQMVLVIDLHSMDKQSALKVLRNSIILFPGSFEIRAIHGYNRGVVLKNAIANELKHERIVSRVSPSWNPGETLLQIA